MAVPLLELNTLAQSDGSATYAAYGCTIIASVNGPVEVTRRDELPEAATIDVSVRPAAGIGGVRERHLETLLHRTLRHVIRVEDLPRTLIQVTLQITTGLERDPTAGRTAQAESNLYFLPLLLNAATLALLTTAIPLDMIPVATMVAVGPGGTISSRPSWPIMEQAASVHVLAYSTQGQLLLAESEGAFDLATWDKVSALTKQLCLNPEHEETSTTDPPPIEALLRTAVERGIRQPRNEAG